MADLPPPSPPPAGLMSHAWAEGHRSGFASFVGRPNAGKSTLTNALVGTKVVITSSKPQTTRTVVRGIVHRLRAGFGSAYPRLYPEESRVPGACVPGRGAANRLPCRPKPRRPRR